ncbi:MAG TPA: hypothetical protein VMW54_12310 [Terriglobia bacterium]|nr:hypothetical protein [Terriglobia bacterium]
MGVGRFKSFNLMGRMAPFSGRQEWFKRAALACGSLPLAKTFSGFDQKSMELIKHSLIARQMLVQELLRGGIVVAGLDQAMARQDAARIGVGDEEGLLAGVKQDGIDGLRPQASQFEQLDAERPGRTGKEFSERSPVSSLEPLDKGLNGARLLPKVAGGADAGFKFRGGSGAQALPLKESAVLKAADRHGDIPPRRVLSEDSAEDDLQASARRPPALRAELLQQQLVILPKHFTRLNSKRLSRALHRLEINTVFGRKSSLGGDLILVGSSELTSEG